MFDDDAIFTCGQARKCFYSLVTGGQVYYWNSIWNNLAYWLANKFIQNYSYAKKA